MDGKKESFWGNLGTSYLILLVVNSLALSPHLGMILGLILGLVIEAPVSGYYAIVMRQDIQSYPLKSAWIALPSFNLKTLPELLQEGMRWNLIMTAYALVSIMPSCAAFTFISFVGAVTGWSSLYPDVMNGIQYGVSGAFAVPGIWVMLVLHPLALARFAASRTLAQAFNLPALLPLAVIPCTKAYLGALTLTIGSAANTAILLLSPLSSWLLEPGIEPLSMIFACRLFAQSYVARLYISELLVEDSLVVNSPNRQNMQQKSEAN